MKKIIYIAIAMLLTLSFNHVNPTAEISEEQFTHVVFAEEFTATWCVYCPSAAENLMKIYEDIPEEPYYGDKFFFVALITDVNDKAEQRMDDYPDVTGYPTVIFDGNDEKVSGGQSDTSNYEQAIDNCGQREDTDIELNINMEHLGSDKLDVKVGMTWNEESTLGNPTFDGYVRAYIVEKVSRYNNYDGDPYHFGFLDYAFDQSIELEPFETLELSTVWIGGEHEDKNGDDFSDIDYDNINIFVAFFNDESTSTDKYVLETAFAIPPTIEIDEIEGKVGGIIEISGEASSIKSEINKIYYKWDQNEWIEYMSDYNGGNFDLAIDTSDVENGNHELSIKVFNGGSSNQASINIEILNDDNPPKLSINNPSEGDTLNEVVVLEVEADDDNVISKVEYKLNEGSWRKMYYSNGEKYIASWNTQEANAGNGEHKLAFKALDANGNSIQKSINITVFNEEDITYPYLEIIEPKGDFYNSKINIKAEASDPEGLKDVKYRMDNGSWRLLSEKEENYYEASWTPTSDGWHWLEIEAEDGQGYITKTSTKLETDGTAPLLTLNTFTKEVTAIAKFNLVVDDYSSLESLKYRINKGEWIDLEQLKGGLDFAWDSTKYNDGECVMDIECIDKWGAKGKLSLPLEVKNQGLIYTAAPSNIVTESLTKINAFIEYEEPNAVTLIVAKTEGEVLSEGQKIPMYSDGKYYYADLFFEFEGSYVYTIEVDTGHGKLSSLEQNIIVSEKEKIVADESEDNMLSGIGGIPIILTLLFISLRKRVSSF